VNGPGNQRPVVTNPGDQTNDEGEGVTLDIVASDPDGDVLTFSASGLPPGLSIDTSSGQISGTLPAGSAGVYNVTVTADDGNGGSDSASFTWTVNGPGNQLPVVTNPGNQTNAEGRGVKLNITASDPDGDALTFSASGLPPGLSIDTGTGQIAGTLTFESAGVYNVRVTVSDGAASTRLTFRWTVNDVKRASKDDDDDDEDDDSPPASPPAPQVSVPPVAPAPTPSVLVLPETGIGGYSEPGPTVWPVIVLPGFGILLGWAIYHNLNKRH
jgi:hypothetical protein